MGGKGRYNCCLIFSLHQHSNASLWVESYQSPNTTHSMVPFLQLFKKQVTVTIRMPFGSLSGFRQKNRLECTEPCEKVMALYTILYRQCPTHHRASSICIENNYPSEKLKNTKDITDYYYFSRALSQCKMKTTVVLQAMFNRYKVRPFKHIFL